VKNHSPARNMHVFFIVWAGQTASIVGSALTSFALGIWVYQQTGSFTQFALIGLFTVLPRVLLSPLAGVLVDRWSRRMVMILADAGAGVCTLALALLFHAGTIEIWHIYLLSGISAVFGTLQWPAYSAATTLLVNKEQLGRANGMIQLGQALSEILAPALAGVLVLTTHVQGVILVDFATFLIAVGTLLFVRFPEPAKKPTTSTGIASLWSEMGFGWRYIVARPGLLGLLVFFALVNFLWGMVGALITPMILGFASADLLGIIISIAGIGMLCGSLIMSAWGGPKNQVAGILLFELSSGICFMLIGLRPWAWLVALGVFGAHLTIAVINGSNQTIWQRKVAPEIQGRVFATRQMIARSTAPLAYAIAGPLADRVFEPLVNAGGFTQIVGAGVGRGVGLLFIVMGIVKVAISLGAYLSPRIRHIEEELPEAVP